MPSTDRSTQVSPTAHYTGYVWTRHGLSHPAFATIEGRLLFNAARPALALSKRLGGPTLEGLLLSRHRVIDSRLERAIAAGEISQVLEIAAGLSPRGWRFARHHGRALHYVEADLPGMAARKRRLLAKAGGGGARHEVVDIAAFAASGALSLAGIAARFDRSRGLAIISEGLLNYFPTPAVTGLWARIDAVLAGFPQGLYLSDLHLGSDNRGPAAAGFAQLLSLFVRGRVHLHFANPTTAEAVLLSTGFASATLHRAADFAEEFPECRDPAARLVRVVEARSRH
ncbi:MAG: class I SAM-dependent methyltransferase [Nevskia sp.]